MSIALVHEAYPIPTPVKYDSGSKPSYAPTPSKTTAAYPGSSSDYPEEENDNSYESGSGYSYSKRAGIVEHRKAVVA